MTHPLFPPSPSPFQCFMHFLNRDSKRNRNRKREREEKKRREGRKGEKERVRGTEEER